MTASGATTCKARKPATPVAAKVQLWQKPTVEVGPRTVQGHERCISLHVLRVDLEGGSRRERSADGGMVVPCSEERHLVGRRARQDGRQQQEAAGQQHDRGCSAYGRSAKGEEADIARKCVRCGAVRGHARKKNRRPAQSVCSWRLPTRKSEWFASPAGSKHHWCVCAGRQQGEEAERCCRARSRKQRPPCNVARRNRSPREFALSTKLRSREEAAPPKEPVTAGSGQKTQSGLIADLSCLFFAEPVILRCTPLNLRSSAEKTVHVAFVQ